MGASIGVAIVELSIRLGSCDSSESEKNLKCFQKNVRKLNKKCLKYC
jgi:hypothetical protein